MRDPVHLTGTVRAIKVPSAFIAIIDRIRPTIPEHDRRRDWRARADDKISSLAIQDVDHFVHFEHYDSPLASVVYLQDLSLCR